MQNAELSDFTRMHFLVASLTGRARDVISAARSCDMGLPTTRLGISLLHTQHIGAARTEPFRNKMCFFIVVSPEGLIHKHNNMLEI